MNTAPITPLSPSDARARFIQLLAEEITAEHAWRELCAAQQKLFEADSAALFVSVFGKRKKFNRTKLQEAKPEESEALYARHKAELNRVAAERKCDWAARQAITDEKRVVGAGAEVRPGTEMLEWHRVSEQSYSSQGYGACKYAENAAELYRLDAEAMGFEAEVIRDTQTYDKNWGGGGTFTVTEFIVRVKVESDVDIRLLDYHDGLSLKETVRALLKRGSNIRVHFPFLPYGYEEKMGLDSWGNDLPAKTAAQG